MTRTPIQWAATLVGLSFLASGILGFVPGITTNAGEIPFMIPVFIGMTLVHVWGAIRRIQPVTETIEIAFWAGLIVLGLLFYPG